MRIVVIGGSGLIGSKLVEKLRIAPTCFEDWLSQTMVRKTRATEVRLEGGTA